MKHCASLLAMFDMTEDALEAFLKRIPPGSLNELHKRRDARDIYRVKSGIVIEFLNGPETHKRARVCPRDLSVTGIGFFHLGRIVCGSRLAVELPIGINAAVIKKGCVVRCAVVTSKVFEVGVAFDKPINKRLLLDSNTSLQ